VEHVAASSQSPADPAGVPRPLEAYAAYVVGARVFGAAADVDVSSSRDHLVDNSAVPEDGYERAEVEPHVDDELHKRHPVSLRRSYSR
jgi:hypothetical protein